jgi:ATP-dependent DNA helicase RecG
MLADALERAGVVERTARGIDLIFFEQLRNGRPAPSYERSSQSGVVLDLPGGAANLEFARSRRRAKRTDRWHSMTSCC